MEEDKPPKGLVDEGKDGKLPNGLVGDDDGTVGAAPDAEGRPADADGEVPPVVVPPDDEPAFC